MNERTVFYKKPTTDESLAKARRVSVFQGTPRLQNQLDQAGQIEDALEMSRAYVKLGQSREVIRTSLVDNAIPYLEKQKSAEIARNLKEGVITSESARDFAIMLTTRTGVDIENQGQILFTFNLEEKHQQICDELKDIPTAYRSASQLQEARKRACEEFASMLQNPQKLQKQSDQIKELAELVGQEQEGRFEGKFFQFLLEEPRRENTTIPSGVATRRIWELPIVHHVPEDYKPLIQAPAPFLDEIADHPLVQTPTVEVEKPAQEYGWVKNHPEITTFLDRLPEPARILFKKFLESDRADWLIKKTVEFQPSNGPEFQDFRNRLSGAIFEQIAYHHLAANYAANQIFLTPEEVHSLYQQIYPERTNKYAGINAGIEGITIPDGFVLSQVGSWLLVETVFDYKLIIDEPSDWDKFNRQLSHYSSPANLRGNLFKRGTVDSSFIVDILNKIRPEISKDSKLHIGEDIRVIYGLPYNSTLDLPDHVKREDVPIHSVDFGHFKNLLLSICRNMPRNFTWMQHPTPTPAEIDDLLQAPQASSELADAALDLPMTSQFNLELESEEDLTDIDEESEPAFNSAEIPDIFGEDLILSEPESRRASTSALERRDPELEKNIERLVKEAIELISSEGATIEVFRSRGVFLLLNQAIGNKWIKPARNADGYHLISRVEYVLTEYQHQVLKRNQGLNKGQRKELEERIEAELAKQQAELNSAKNRNTNGNGRYSSK